MFMARKSSIRYWASRGAYCCEFQGRQHVLAKGPDDYPHGETYKAAFKAFGDLLRLENAEHVKDENTVWVVCELYLRHVSQTKKPGTYEVRRGHLVTFCEKFGEQTVRSLTPFAVSRWIEEHRVPGRHPKTGIKTGWHDGTVIIAIVSVKAAFT
jgi:hypothetical protein